MTRRRLLAVILAAALAGCGTRAIDYPLTEPQANADRRMPEISRDHPFIVVTFSGGGSRAAALAAAVTGRLNTIRYPANGATRALAQDVAIVSSVSGGSAYAADLALNQAEHAQAFEDTIKTFDGISYLKSRFLNPKTWVDLQFENKTRIDILQDMLDTLLVPKGATLDVLNRPGRPLFLFNASDMVAGEVFTFDPGTLDDLCMTYSRTPLTLAVTASAAFPVAFTPVLLQNNSYVDKTGCRERQLRPGDWRTQVTNAAGRYGNIETYRQARYRDSLRGARYVDDMPTESRKQREPFREPAYVRLVDGGVVDNLGLTAVRRAFSDPDSPTYLDRMVAQNKLGRLVVIVVNARSDARNALDGSPRYTNLLATAGGISGALVDSAAAGAAANFRGFLANLAEDRAALIRDGQDNAKFEIYPIEIDFDQLPDSTAAERQTLNAVKAIGTSWTLKPGDVELIHATAGQLLWRHPCFRLLMTDLGVNIEPIQEAGAVPQAVCIKPPIDNP